MILVAGGTGTIGKGLLPILRKIGTDVGVLTRNKELHKKNPDKFFLWDPLRYIDPILQRKEITGIIYLAGFPVWKIWHPLYLKKMYKSRAGGTLFLRSKMAEWGKRLHFFIGMSSIAIYYSHGFLKNLTIKWEQATRTMEKVANSILILRTGIVISPHGGMLPIMCKMGKICPFLPVPFQPSFYWIDYRDLNEVILRHFFKEHSIQGGVSIINCFNPVPLRWTTALKTLRMIAGLPWGRPFPILPEPGYIIEKKFFPEEGFKYTSFEDTLKDFLKRKDPAANK